MSTTNHPDQPPSRLDRELDEILSQANAKPISFQERVAQRRNAAASQKQATVRSARRSMAGTTGFLSTWLLNIPLVTALLLALGAAWVRDAVPVLAIALGVAAIAFVFLPFFRRGPVDNLSYQKRWRGRVIEPTSAPTGSVRQMIDRARDRLQR